MSRVNVSVEHLYQQGFGPASRRIGVRGLARMGDSLTFSTCVQGYDANSNPVACNDPSAVVWMDANGNAVPAGGGSSSSGWQSVFGTEEFGGAAPGSGGSYPGVKNTPPVSIAVQTFPQGSAALPPGPANRINIPVSPSIPGSFEMWLTNNTLFSPLPNWGTLAVLFFGVPALLGSAFSAGRYKVTRRR